ncbi:MAG: hypothetical protein ACE5JI_10730 [Acidobacteriota bacterium]
MRGDSDNHVLGGGSSQEGLGEVDPSLDPVRAKAAMFGRIRLRLQNTSADSVPGPQGGLGLRLPFREEREAWELTERTDNAPVGDVTAFAYKTFQLLGVTSATAYRGKDFAADFVELNRAGAVFLKQSLEDGPDPVIEMADLT